MGYEMRFYIVNKSSSIKDNIKGKNYNYGQIVAMYDYCKDYKLADFIDKVRKPSNTYIYVNEKETVADCYGQELSEIPLNDLINYLEMNPDDYRRYIPFLSLLKGFQTIQERAKETFEDLAVIVYGY